MWTNKKKKKELIVSSILTSTISPSFGNFARVNPQTRLSKYKNVDLELY